MESFEYVVVVDPDCGFVIGGGYIKSPKGAFLADEDITGKAHFAFMAKYHKRKKTPRGATRFYLKEAKIKFKSKTYDWLMVNGNVAMYQGTDKIKKDRNNYRFQVSAMDDGRGKKAEDKYRLQLWNIVSGALIYDNQLPDDPNALPTDVVDRGAIVIHHYKQYIKEEKEELVGMKVRQL
jgi:hypothetical protein